MVIFMILMIVVFICIYSLANYYIGLRAWQHIAVHIPFINGKVYWSIVLFVAFSYIVAMVLSKYLPESIYNILSYIGYYWMAIMLYLLLVLPIIDIVRIINSKKSIIPSFIMDRVNFSLVLPAFVLVLLVGIMAYGTWSGRSVKITKYDLSINKKSESMAKLKVAMLSDIHLGNIIGSKRLEEMVDKINELNPDVVLLAGDIIDSKLQPFVKENMGDIFKKINAKYGVYACLGNHEGIEKNVEAIVKQYEGAGIKVLRDESILVDNSIYLVGRDDPTLFRGKEDKRKNLSSILEGVDTGKPVILLDHQPRNLEEAEKNNVDLQVSGHTHRGQFAPINMITSRIFEVDFGYLKKGDLNVIVSSGFGTWGPPIRIGSRSEIVEINLNFNK